MKANAEYIAHMFSNLEYSIIPVHYPNLEYPPQTVRYLRGPIDDKCTLFAHGEGTYGIPEGRSTVEYSCWFF